MNKQNNFLIKRIKKFKIIIEKYYDYLKSNNQ